jgi:putative DNA primase/helicase
VQKATSGYLSEMDLFMQFITQCIVERRGKEIRASHVYEVYRDWATGQGERPVSNTKFGTAMVERRYHKIKREKGISYLDIGVIRNER